MNTRTTHMGLWASSWLSLGTVLILGATASAQQNQRYYPQQQPQGGYAPPAYNQPAQGYPQQAPNYPQQPPAGYGYGYPQQPPPQTRCENPIQFLPKFGKKMSEMVRRVFYGQDSSGYDAPQQGGYYGQSGQPLDAPPRQYQAAPAYPQQPSAQTGIYPPPAQYPYSVPRTPAQAAGPQPPRYTYPPQQQAAPGSAPRTQAPQPQSKAPAPAPQSQSKSSTRTYTPPKVTQSPPKTTSKPATTSKPKVTEQPPAPPPPTTSRRSEITPRETPPPTTASNTPSSSSNKSSLGSGSFLKGKKTAKPGRVISPYPPYKELDITGLESGSLALDPTTQKVFEVP